MNKLDLLEEIVPGKKTRTYLRIYLSNFPTSYHPLDIERLDRFICALYKYRSKISIPKLKNFLVSELDWDLNDAEWCINRIYAGIEILKTYKKLDI